MKTKVEPTLEELKKQGWEEVLETKADLILQKRTKNHLYRMLYNKALLHVMLTVEILKDNTSSVRKWGVL
jgi:predicted secreted acid phosphatase